MAKSTVDKPLAVTDGFVRLIDITQAAFARQKAEIAALKAEIDDLKRTVSDLVSRDKR